MPRREVEVEIKCPVEGQKDWALTKVRGRFHCWAYKQSKNTDQKLGGAESVAIVELPDGRVRLATPERVRFLAPEVAT
jgi:hypothetical protein